MTDRCAVGCLPHQLITGILRLDLSEFVSQPLRDAHLSGSGRSLGAISLALAIKGSRDGDGTPIEIYVAPSQTQELTLPHTRDNCSQVERVTACAL